MMSSQEILIWNYRLTESLGILKSDEDAHFDCCLIVGKNSILVHKSALQLNCAILKMETCTSHNANSGKDITEIEIDMEFADHKDLITKIVSSFYNGEFQSSDDLNEMMVVYKFCKLYSVKWLAEVTRKRFIGLMKTNKTDTEKADQFVKLFIFAHEIWCTDLMDDCIELLDDVMIETLMNDPSGFLAQLNYHYLKTLTASDKVIAGEENLFRLLEAWISCQEHVPLSYIELTKQIRYQLIDTTFLMENVMKSYVITVSDFEHRKELLKTAQGTITTGDQNITKSASRADHQFHIEISELVKTLLTDTNTTITKDVKIKVIDGYIDTKFSNISAQEKEKFVIGIWEADVFKELTFPTFIKIVDACQSHRTVILFYDLVIKLCKIDQSNPEWTSIDWKLVPFSVIDFFLSQYFETVGKVPSDTNSLPKWNYPEHHQLGYSIFVEMTMTWCLAHPYKTENIRSIVNKHLCFQNIPSIYNEHILLPTIKYLVPDFVEGCKHSGECNGAGGYRHGSKFQDFSNKLYSLDFCVFDVYLPIIVTFDTSGVSFKFRTGVQGKGIVYNPNRLHANPYPYYRHNYSMDTIKEFIKRDKVYWMVNT